MFFTERVAVNRSSNRLVPSTCYTYYSIINVFILRENGTMRAYNTDAHHVHFPRAGFLPLLSFCLPF